MDLSHIYLAVQYLHFRFDIVYVNVKSKLEVLSNFVAYIKKLEI